MEAAIRDLLPDEVDLLVNGSDAFPNPLPSEILQYQAERLGQRTNGFVKARILRSESEKEVVLSFELEATSLDFTATLFKVRQRPRLEYPALIVPPEPLPAFLQPTIKVKKVKKGMFGSEGSLFGLPQPFDVVEESTESNHWLAVTAEEFEDKLAEVMRLPQVRSIFQNLSSQPSRHAPESQSGHDESSSSP